MGQRVIVMVVLESNLDTSPGSLAKSGGFGKNTGPFRGKRQGSIPFQTVAS